MRLELESNYECKVLKLPFDITSTEQIDYAIDVIKNAVTRLRGISSSYAYTPSCHKSSL